MHRMPRFQFISPNLQCSSVSSLAISRTGACVLSAGMDRQVRVWERTSDIVFLEEEKELELERRFDSIDSRNEGQTGDILGRKSANGDDQEELPQSEAAVKQSVLSVAAGDRILAAIELADQELKTISNARKHNKPDTETPKNLLMLGMGPTAYVLWVLKSVKQAELEQSLLILPVEHVSRILYYLVLLLRKGQGVEICSRVAVFLVKTHQHQIQANNWKLARPLQELKRLLRLRLGEYRSMVGFNISGLQLAAQNSSRMQKIPATDFLATEKGIWAGIAK